MNQRDSQEAYLRKLARRNVCDGILYEPRIYHDAFTVPSGTRTVRHNPDAFRNGEQFPVRIRYITACMARQDAASPPVAPVHGDERLIQRYALRIEAHDSYYMSGTHMPLPLWHNRRVAGPDPASRGMAVWQFDHAFPLGQRDTLVVNVELLSAPANARGVTVSFTGVGRASRRPYLLSSRLRLTGVAPVQMSTDDFRNDGAEVIDITQMGIFVESDENASNPAGDVREARIQIEQTGNGTNHNWAITDPTLVDRVPVCLLGPSVGRAIVHELPGDGWLWQPGQGVSPEILNIDTTRSVEETVHIAMLGHIIVT